LLRFIGRIPNPELQQEEKEQNGQKSHAGCCRSDRIQQLSDKIASTGRIGIEWAIVEHGFVCSLHFEFLLNGL